MTTESGVWDRIAADYAASAHDRDLSTISYGPAGDERELRLLGRLDGRRVLDLGCGPGHNAIAAARQGAHAIGVDVSPAMIAEARKLAAEHEVRVEWRVSDLMELAWLRADSVDIAIATGLFAHVSDLDRALRSVHRVLRTGAPLVFTHPHPFAMCVAREHDGEGTLPLGRHHLVRSYFDDTPIAVERDGVQLTVHPRTVSDILDALNRAGFALDALVEPESLDGGAAWVPSSLVVLAKKLGS